MATSQANIEQLAHLVQSLPQELYDCVYNLTFTANDEEVNIFYTYSPPRILAVSRATRTQAAATYYSTTTFFCSSRRYLFRWLLSLSSPHLSYLRKTDYHHSVVGMEEVAQEARELV